MQFENLASLYQYLDDLILEPSERINKSSANISHEDELFASSYIRGFIALAAVQYGDENQELGDALATNVSDQLHAARSELTPQDQQIVKLYWLELKQAFQAN